MAGKSRNCSPGVWLGLLLVLVAHTLAKSTLLKEVPDPENPQKNDDYTNYEDPMVFDKLPHSTENRKEASIEPTNDNAKDISSSKETSVNITDSILADTFLNKTFVKTNDGENSTTVKSAEHFDIQKDETIPTIATIDFEKHPTTNNSEEPIEETKEPTEIENFYERPDDVNLNKKQQDKEKGEDFTTVHQEFELIEEHENFEEQTSSNEFAEATTPSSKLLDSSRRNAFDNPHTNIEHFDVRSSEDGGKVTISLANDTNVNYYLHFPNGTKKFHVNSTGAPSGIDGSTLAHEPKHEVEIFDNASHRPVLRISEEPSNETVIEDSTTPYYSNLKPKGRTISVSGENDVSTKKPKIINQTNVDSQTTSDTIVRVFPKKSMSTEKPAELKPYPYLKTDNKFSEPELVTEIITKIENSTDEISPYENTIGRKKTDEKIIVTESSVLVENSIQQFKPVNYKRSGNSSRINSTFDTPVAATGWTSATTENLESRNAVKVTEESQTTLPGTENRSQIDNDVPQGNPNSTERSPTILSEVTENNIENVIKVTNGTSNPTAATSTSRNLIEHRGVTDPEVVAENISERTLGQVSSFTEKVQTVSNGSSTSNEVQAENNDSKLTVNQLNVTEILTDFSPSRDDLLGSTEVFSTVTEKLNSESESAVSSPIKVTATSEFVEESSSQSPSSVTKLANPVEENTTSVTGFETDIQSTEKNKNISKSTSSETTTVEYEFVGLTESGTSSMASQDYIASSEKSNTLPNILNATSNATESQETTETMITEDNAVQNETTFSKKIETADPENAVSSTTQTFEDTTIFIDGNSEATTSEDLSNATSSSITEDSFTTSKTDVYPDTTFSSTSTSINDKGPDERVDLTTTGQSPDSEEITTTTMMTGTEPATEEATTVSNIEVIVSSETAIATSPSQTTIVPGTTLQTETTSQLPEFTVSSDDVTLFVRIIIEGSWNDICPVLSNLRVALANLLTEETGRTVLARNIIFYQTQCSLETTSNTAVTPVLLYVVDDNGNFDYAMTEILPNLYKQSPFIFSLMIHSVEKLIRETEPSNNAIAVVAVSSVAFICLVLLAGLLFIMRKRQTRFNYGERCRPVSLDSYRVDSVSAYNSVRRKDLARASKRSYGNPAFEDSSVTPSHPLNFAGLSSFCNDSNAIAEEFAGIPQVSARIDELPAGAEVKNRYANVVPLPETRVPLQKINNEPLTEYINASYVRGPKNATKYYIACQAPIESTVADFWRMIWEQQSKVIIMLTDIIENGVEKCVDYIPPSEVTDCHRLYGDYQVTLKKHEAKEKYAISTLHLKNLENNTYREVSHIWYLWPTNGVPSDATGLIAILLEARALQRGAPGPIVVHCSPGTGRTGTLIALDLGIRQYEITRTVDVPRVVYTIRRDRAGAVQTKEQYAFIYKALNLYAAKLAGGALESM